MILRVNGVNLIPYVFRQGVKWQRSDIDDSDAGRLLDGSMFRARVASKIRLDVTCRPLTTSEASIVLSAIYPQWVTVQYTDPRLGRTVTKTMYSNNTPASYLVLHDDGTEWWDGIEFPLIEE